MATGVAAVGLGLLAILVLALVVGGGRPAPETVLGAGAGAVTGWALPVTTLASHVAAVGTVGSIVFAAVLARSRGGGMTGAASRSVRSASWWATGWAASVAVTAVLTVSDLLGIPLSALTPGLVLDVVTGFDSGRALAVTVGLAAAFAVGARRSVTVRGADILLLLAIVAVLPTTLTGHAATAANHEIAVTSLMVHVLSATVWVGGLLALVTYGRQAGDALPRAAARFSELAFVCFVGAGVSGLLNAWIALGGGSRAIEALWTSGYGWLVLAKLAALVVLGGFGWWHRRRTLRRLAAGRPRAFRRLAAVEVVVLLATIAMAVALARTPTPEAGTNDAAATPGASTAAAPAAEAPPAPTGETPAGQDMSGHDHGPLQVGILITEGTFMVDGPVPAGGNVSVLNAEEEPQTITADDGTFDVDASAGSLFLFPAPTTPGEYPFTSSANPDYRGVLVVE